MTSPKNNGEYPMLKDKSHKYILKLNQVTEKKHVIMYFINCIKIVYYKLKRPWTDFTGTGFINYQNKNE